MTHIDKTNRRVAMGKKKVNQEIQEGLSEVDRKNNYRKPTDSLYING